jgi:hypothetical protein
VRSSACHKWQPAWALQTHKREVAQHQLGNGRINTLCEPADMVQKCHIHVPLSEVSVPEKAERQQHKESWGLEK